MVLCKVFIRKLSLYISKGCIEHRRIFIVQPHLYGSGESGKKIAKARLEENIGLIEALNRSNQSWTVCKSLIYRMRLGRSGVLSRRSLLFRKGNLEIIRDDVPDECTDVFLAVPWLSNRQSSALQEQWGKPILDRAQIVMSIFKRHAKSKLAKLQVEIAEILYYLGRTDHSETLRLKLHYLQNKLHRERVAVLHSLKGCDSYENLPLVAVVGYRYSESRFSVREDMVCALRNKHCIDRKMIFEIISQNPNRHEPSFEMNTNVGKTSLIKSLVRNESSDQLEVEDRLFVTLDISVHKICSQTKRIPLLLMDTVGFVSELGSSNRLVEAFSATLSEALLKSQLILLMFDASHPEKEFQRKYVSKTIDCILGDQEIPRIEVWNKIDQCSAELTKNLDGPYKISCKTKQGLSDLISGIETNLLNQSKPLVTDLLLRIQPECLYLIYRNLKVSGTFFDNPDIVNGPMLISVLIMGSDQAKYEQTRFISELIKKGKCEIVK
ncbi:hypothetical protein ACOME3_003328 [Neoechinorhynchus agilis]